ncbi:MAG: YjbQ family protein [Thermoplasmata archaeon]|nr:YjbQ family protein [Thermoplasmata archaeon]
MKVFADFVEVRSERRGEYIDITTEIEKMIDKSEVKNGVVIIHELHTTAALTIQENDTSVHEDTKEIMDRLVPLDREYRHSYEGNANAVAHIKNQIFGSNLAIPVIDGKIALGTWQRIFLIELFETRHRKIAVSIIGE